VAARTDGFNPGKERDMAKPKGGKKGGGGGGKKCRAA
jgi:hypothetical protein